MLPDSDIARVLIIIAHPDDADWWAGGTIAGWSDAGITTTYLVLTDGDAGGVDTTPRSHIPAIRRAEQRAAADILGVHDVRFLGWAEGTLTQAPQTRAELVRVIRQVRPHRVVTWSPQWNWAYFRTSCHVDHRATGELALTAIYPDAGNPHAHPALREDLPPWTVPEIWLINSPEPTHYRDVTHHYDRKIRALRAHTSQTAHRGDLADEVTAKFAPYTTAASLPTDHHVEAFHVITNS